MAFGMLVIYKFYSSSANKNLAYAKNEINSGYNHEIYTYFSTVVGGNTFYLPPNIISSEATL